MLDEGEVASFSQPAKKEGLTRARVTQIMNLLKLSDEMQDFLPGWMIRWRSGSILKGGCGVPSHEFPSRHDLTAKPIGYPSILENRHSQCKSHLSTRSP
jgi:hypothetical protein